MPSNEKIYKDFENSGGEQNFRKKFNNFFFNGKGDIDINDIDLTCKNITFETKFNTKDRNIDMFIQLIATHKKHNIPFKSFLGCANEYGISILQTNKLNFDKIDLDWENLTPSNLSEEQKMVIKNKIDITLSINKFFRSEINSIKKIFFDIENDKVDLEENKISEKDINQIAIELNNKLHKFGILEAERPLFFTSIILALTDNIFYKTYSDYGVIDELSEKVREIAVKEIQKESNNDNPNDKKKQKRWELILSSIVISSDGKDVKKLIGIINTIKKDIFDKTNKLTVNFDILGKCYNIFLTYGKKEKKGDITLTPEHIKLLMIKLLDVNYNDVILDTCTGSGGFLVKALHYMFNKLEENKELLQEDIEEYKRNIKKYQLLGIDNEPKMFALACSNMKLNGDGKSNIKLGDSKVENLLESFKYEQKIDNRKEDIIPKPTIGIINPPYSKDQSIEFLNILCKNVNGRVAIICPNNFLDKTKKITIRKELFENNTLKAVIKCNSQLFMNGVDASIFIFETKRKHKFDIDEVYYYNFENDGFKVMTRNGRIQVDNTEEIINDLVIDYQNKTTNTINSYCTTLKNRGIAYNKNFNKNEDDINIKYQLTKEDFEETIFDYFVSQCGGV